MTCRHPDTERQRSPSLSHACPSGHAAGDAPQHKGQGQKCMRIGNDSVLAQLIRWFGRKKNVEKVGQAVSLKIDDRKFQE